MNLYQAGSTCIFEKDLGNSLSIIRCTRLAILRACSAPAKVSGNQSLRGTRHRTP